MAHVEAPAVPRMRMVADWITAQNVHAMTAGLYAKSSGNGHRGARAIDLNCSPAASAGLQLEHSRWVLADRLELRMRIDPCRPVAPITLELWRPK